MESHSNSLESLIPYVRVVVPALCLSTSLLPLVHPPAGFLALGSLCCLTLFPAAGLDTWPFPLLGMPTCPLPDICPVTHPSCFVLNITSLRTIP